MLIKLIITENEDRQRLDRFLKKYLSSASLGYIYKMIRKDVKLNSKRPNAETFLNVGDELILYISQEEADSLSQKKKTNKAKKQFQVAYEDENILIVEKPFGILTHGDSKEKKNHLANQIISYLIEKDEYKPGRERTFTPSPVNRLDRNTTGLVLFGKNNKSLQSLNQMIREDGHVSKFYIAVVLGEMKRELLLRDKMEKDHKENKVSVLDFDSDNGKIMETIARPLAITKNYTLVEVELVTGRTHQIRAHLAKAGYPIMGDSKYGNRALNRKVEIQFGITTQFLHAYRLFFKKGIEPLEYIENLEVKSQLPPNLEIIAKELFKDFKI